MCWMSTKVSSSLQMHRGDSRQFHSPKAGSGGSVKTRLHPIDKWTQYNELNQLISGHRNSWQADSCKQGLPQSKALYPYRGCIVAYREQWLKNMFTSLPLAHFHRQLISIAEGILLSFTLVKQELSMLVLMEHTLQRQRQSQAQTCLCG